MTNEEILKAAIEKAGNNGYSKHIKIVGEPCLFVVENLVKHNGYQRIIFSHEFAKAFFGEKSSARISSVEVDEFGNESGEVVTQDFNDGWELSLQKMVISKDPIQYLKDFL